MRFPITEHVHKSARHTTFALACGPAEGQPILFLHGWPELSISWRHQLQCFAALGFRAIAPDMRGYGRSSVHPRHADYALEHSVRDMIELLDSLGCGKAVWVGHDWGAPVVWGLAAHHADRCLAVANLCVPYMPRGFAPDEIIPLVDRRLYPQAEFPAGQWDYQRFYEESFEKASAVFDADPLAMVKAMFRKGDPTGRGKPSRLAHIRRDGGWFGGATRPPDVPMDPDVLTEQELHRYASALAANGFFGPDSWYMNGPANAAYAQAAPNQGRLSMPVLFLHAAYDYVCDTIGDSQLPVPMRAACADLGEVTIASGHWMAQERPAEVNAALARWLASRLPQCWRA